MTIRNFSDHAANERTFLAWVRTAIAVMAFGFLVERFDLFLQIAARSIGARAPQIAAPILGHLAGLVLIIAGVAMMIISAVRFVFVAKMIDSTDEHGHFGSRLDIALAAMLALLGCALFIYLLHAVAPA
jgi:putative membrane protein